MWIAKLVDQKQGEARVVDQREVLRSRLEDWLKNRPSLDEVAQKGVLGRGARFAVARGVIDSFLRDRLHAQEEERSRIPPGDFVYSERISAILGGDGPMTSRHSNASLAEYRLRSTRAERDDVQAKLDKVATSWAEASENCQRSVRTHTLPGLASSADNAVRRLEELHKSTGGSLACVFEELAAFRRLVARQRCLEDIVAMMEKTESLREAVFSWHQAESVPLSSLDEIPALWAKLPPRSRTVGVKRLRFLLSPIKSSLTQELKDELTSTKRWPLEAGAQAMTVNASGKTESVTGEGAKPPPTGAARVMWFCAELLRAQRADEETCKEEGASAQAETKENDRGATWAGDAMAAPLAARFRWLFCRPESDLCRMDKPEWAFQFLTKLCSEHCAELEAWEPPANSQAAAKLQAAQAEALRSSNLRASLAVALGREARLFMRARMPLLVDSSARPLLLHSLQYLVRLHGELNEIGGANAAAAVFADFDANRPIDGGVVGSVAATAGAQGEQVEDSGGGSPSSWMKGLSNLRKGGNDSGGLLSGISHLRKDEAMQKQAAGQDSSLLAGFEQGFAGFEQGLEQFADSVSQEVDTAKFADVGPAVADSNPGARDAPVGCLDLWAAADGELVRGWLSTVTSSSGKGWKPRRISGSSAVSEEAPEAAELATLLCDRFEKAKERADCLSSKKARKLYSAKVFESGLRLALTAIRSRWNAMRDPLGADAKEAALLVETLEEICRFMDDFAFGEFMVEAVDDASAFRIGALDKLADMLCDIVRGCIGQLYTEASVLTYTLAQPLLVLSVRLRPTNFRVVAQRAINNFGDLLTNVLMRQPAFGSPSEMATFVANCQSDLRSVLAQVVPLDDESTAPVRKLWDGCALLALGEVEAADAFAGLRQIHRCVPASDLRKPWPQAAAVATEAATASGSEVIRRKLADVLQPAGVQELSVNEALLVLCKRPDLAKVAADDAALQEHLRSLAGAGALQDLLSGTAQEAKDLLSGTAQEALQLGSGALQLGTGALRQLGTQAPIPTASLRSILPGKLVGRS